MGNRFGVVLTDVPDGLAQRRLGNRGFTSQGMSNAHATHDTIVRIPQGDLRGAAPASGVIETANQLDSREDPLSLQHPLVIQPALVCQRQAADVEVGAPEKIEAALKAEIQHKGQIHPLVAPYGIFYPQQYICQVVEHLEGFRRSGANALQNADGVRIANLTRHSHIPTTVTVLAANCPSATSRRTAHRISAAGAESLPAHHGAAAGCRLNQLGGHESVPCDNVDRFGVMQVVVFICTRSRFSHLAAAIDRPGSRLTLADSSPYAKAAIENCGASGRADHHS